MLESAQGRANVVTRIEGTDRSLPALIVHGHLDVVPAFKEEWSVDPFGAEIKDGMIWGRGAVDMKDMDAMILAVMREMQRTGTRPRRDLVFAFFADEEAGGDYGARWMVDNHPELFEGATEAISEVGGFSATIDGKRAYLLQTAEKGIAWLKLTADGPCRARVADQRGKRGDPAGRRHHPHRRARLADLLHRHHARLP